MLLGNCNRQAQRFWLWVLQAAREEVGEIQLLSLAPDIGMVQHNM
jgi:hypothetical protein